MTTEDWFEALTAELLAQSPFRRSEYFTRFASGALSREQVWAHIAQHYLLIAWFPRIFSGIHTRCDDFEARKDCARHLLVEDLGYLNGCVGATPDHDELFRRIGDDLGYSRDAYDRIVPVPEMAAIVAFFRELAHERPWSAALCATALLEEEVVEIARTLAAGVPPRAPARSLWRVSEPWLEEAQNDATLLAIRAQEDAGLDIITDGETRRESYSNRFATALDGVDIDNPGTGLDRSGHPNPVPRIVGPIRRARPVMVDDVKFLRAHTTRTIKMTVPGPFTMSQQAQNDYYGIEEEAAMD